jgi:hypothetical protein
MKSFAVLTCKTFSTRFKVNLHVRFCTATSQYVFTLCKLALVFENGCIGIPVFVRRYINVHNASKMAAMVTVAVIASVPWVARKQTGIFLFIPVSIQPRNQVKHSTSSVSGDFDNAAKLRSLFFRPTLR